MIFLIKVTPSEYEKIIRLIICAHNAENALEIAKKEVEENNNSLGIIAKDSFEIENFDLQESRVLMKEFDW